MKKKELSSTDRAIALGKRVLEVQNETAKRHRAAGAGEWHFLQTVADTNVAKAKIDLQSTEAAIKVNELKVTLHRETLQRVLRARRNAAHTKWLQAEYASILFDQCSSYFKALDAFARKEFIGGIKDKLRVGLFRRPVILPSLWTSDKASTSTWCQVIDLISRGKKRAVRCSDRFANLIEQRALLAGTRHHAPHPSER